MLRVDAHPLLALRAFITELPKGLPSAPWLAESLSLEARAPLASSDELRARIRDLLRIGGFKPTGRSKPASEYLLRAAAEGRLGSINALVDACNVVSLHSGLPISVVDLDRTIPPLRVGLAAMGASYAFNASGQSLDLGGLLCLHDAEGPCANAVKDAQRTKTDDTTTRTLSLLWGVVGEEDRLGRAEAWYRTLLHELGATTLEAPCQIS
jgi:DNA/RNA-binding domain of Phe-tRNA-synthetase-like protein